MKQKKIIRKKPCVMLVFCKSNIISRIRRYLYSIPNIYPGGSSEISLPIIIIGKLRVFKIL